MLITYPQIKRIHGLLKATGETAWKQDYVAEASNNRVFSMADLTIDEAHVMSSLLHDVQQGLRKPLNPATKFIEQAHTIPAINSVETPAAKANRLRKGVLRYCHDMKWYKKEGEILILKDDKPQLDYNRIDNYCKTHSAAKKALNEHTVDELVKLVFQFKKMAENTVFKPTKA